MIDLIWEWVRSAQGLFDRQEMRCFGRKNTVLAVLYKPIISPHFGNHAVSAGPVFHWSVFD